MERQVWFSYYGGCGLNDVVGVVYSNIECIKRVI